MSCQEFKEIFDSYLGDELLIETNHDVLRHLEKCASCRSELADRRELRARVRSAVKNSADVQINPVFAARLKSNLRETALRPTFWEKIKSGNASANRLLAGAAMCVLLIIFAGFFWLNRSNAPTLTADSNLPQNTITAVQTPAETNLIQAVQVAWREMTRHAVGDHENCALEFHLKENPITLDEAALKYEKYNKNLDKVVIAPLREAQRSEKNLGKIELLESHSCVFEGRRFAHVVLQYQKRRVSVLVTDTDLPVEDSKQISTQTFETMRVASFRVGQHAVFVVSDLPEKDNAIIAEAIAPSVARHIEKTSA